MEKGELISSETQQEVIKITENQILKAREVIKKNDKTGKKLNLFNEALDFLIKEKRKVAETPIYHSTSSYGLYKILETGFIDSKNNNLTGEQVATGKSNNETSFVVDGYRESELVSHFYARKNEKESSLVIDSVEIIGDDAVTGRKIVNTKFQERKNLKPEEKEYIEKNFDEIKETIKREEGRELTEEEYLEEMVIFLKGVKYYYDNKRTKRELKSEIKNLRDVGGNKDKEYLKNKIKKLKEKILIYENETDENKDLLDNPYGAILVYEGRDLPEEDLNKFTSGLICERRTKASINNSNIREIHIPISKKEQVEGWIKKRLERLPSNSKERMALERINIIPLEYFEVKEVLQNQK